MKLLKRDQLPTITKFDRNRSEMIAQLEPRDRRRRKRNRACVDGLRLEHRDPLHPIQHSQSLPLEDDDARFTLPVDLETTEIDSFIDRAVVLPHLSRALSTGVVAEIDCAASALVA